MLEVHQSISNIYYVMVLNDCKCPNSIAFLSFNFAPISDFFYLFSSSDPNDTPAFSTFIIARS